MIDNRLVICAIISLSVALNSCGGEAENISTTEEEVTIDTTTIDTVVNVEIERERIQYDISEIISRVDSVFTLPLKVDSAFIEDVFSGQGEEGALSNAEVQYLGFDVIESLPSQQGDFCIWSFIEIDSLKMRDEYETYLDNLDIGNTEDATANLIGKLSVGADSYYVLWSTTYHTMSACPYGEGSYVWATYFVANEPKQVVLLGEDSGGGDAPYWGSTYVTSVITKSKITTTRIDESGGEEDENGDEIIDSKTEKYTVNVSPEGLIVD